MGRAEEDSRRHQASAWSVDCCGNFNTHHLELLLGQSRACQARCYAEPAKATGQHLVAAYSEFFKAYLDACQADNERSLGRLEACSGSFGLFVGQREAESDGDCSGADQIDLCVAVGRPEGSVIFV